MALVSLRATFLLCCGLQLREARSSIIRIDVSNMHWGRGGRFSGGRVGSSDFSS